MRSEPLRTEPPDETVDFGPVHSPSALVGCTTVLGLLALIFLIVWLATGATLLVIPTLLFGAPSIICLILSNSEEQRDGTRRPESAIDVLRETLKFKLTHGRKEVGVTAFFRPDTASPGQATCLLIFMQSCATRSRRLRISFAFRGADSPPHFPALHPLQTSEPDFSILHQLTVAGPEDEIEIVAPEPHAL